MHSEHRSQRVKGKGKHVLRHDAEGQRVLSPLASEPSSRLRDPRVTPRTRVLGRGLVAGETREMGKQARKRARDLEA
jgi:hypothetical protein